MRPTLAAVLALAIALPLAGCTGGDDAKTQGDVSAGISSTRGPRDGDPASNATVSPSNGTTGRGAGNGTGSPTGNGTATPPAGNQTGNATGNQTGNATGNATWSYDNRTGRVSGTGPAAVLTATHEATEILTVANGTENLTVGVGVTGREVTVTIRPPACTAAACATTFKVADGKSSNASFDAPDDGDWSVTLAITGSGTISADYELGLAQLAVRGNGTA